MSKAKGRELRAKGRRRRVARAVERALKAQATTLHSVQLQESRRLDEAITLAAQERSRWGDAFKEARS